MEPNFIIIVIIIIYFAHYNTNNTIVVATHNFMPSTSQAPSFYWGKNTANPKQ